MHGCAFSWCTEMLGRHGRKRERKSRTYVVFKMPVLHLESSRLCFCKRNYKIKQNWFIHNLIFCFFFFSFVVQRSLLRFCSSNSSWYSLSLSPSTPRPPFPPLCLLHSSCWTSMDTSFKHIQKRPVSRNGGRRIGLSEFINPRGVSVATLLLDRVH